METLFGYPVVEVEGSDGGEAPEIILGDLRHYIRWHIKEPCSKCAICGDSLDVQHPNSLYGQNPLTFHRVWMHLRCWKDVYDALRDEPASTLEYENRQDEYDQKVA